MLPKPLTSDKTQGDDFVMNKAETLKDKCVAILTCEGFEQSELFEPLKALREAGAEIHVVSPTSDSEIRSWKDGEWSDAIKVDKKLEEVSAKDYDALLLPGGVINPDKLRREKSAIEFAKHFLESGKPLAAICHGPQLLIETKLLKDRKMTSYSSIRTDLENAGVHWVDEEVVVDRGIVSSRSPKDLKAFIEKMIEEIAEGRHERSLKKQKTA
jgi:protease I